MQRSILHYGFIGKVKVLVGLLCIYAGKPLRCYGDVAPIKDMVLMGCGGVTPTYISKVVVINYHLIGCIGW